jgi:hypothetical protein
MNYSIKENSWIARLAAFKLKTKRVAIVIGSTIHLHHTTKEEFLNDQRWVKHELCHVRQFRENGFLSFIAKYVWESIKNGYYNNKYEAEAREAEKR